ncbi:MAG: metallophosphoesterase [Campylobacterales bacterium]|nr:metallophosphoesterase [Campylobacterales bacterium]
MFHELKENAILIADCHYSLENREFFDFLILLQNEIIKTNQLILCGDIFDLLIYEIKDTIKKNSEIINLLNKLSKKIEIVYLEGNHDFNLKKIFPNMKIFKIHEQPVMFKFNSIFISISHGDIFSNLTYKLYTFLIRCRYVLIFLQMLDMFFLNNKIVKAIYKKLELKKRCFDIENFKNIVDKRVFKYLSFNKNIEYIIEGHFHQNQIFKYNNLIYQNLSAFDCNKSFFVVKSNQKDISFEEYKLRSFDVRR